MKDKQKIFQRPLRAQKDQSFNIFWDTYLHWDCVEASPPVPQIYQRSIDSSPGTGIFSDTYLHCRCIQVRRPEIKNAKHYKENCTYNRVIELAKMGEKQVDIAFYLGRSRALISQYVKRAKEEGRL